MTGKIDESRRSAFLKTLGESGNFTLAAERAKVSRSWVLLHRKRDAEFDAACGEALRSAEMALRARPSSSLGTSGEGKAGQSFDELRTNGKGGGGTQPPIGWSHRAGVELVVRGTGDGIGGHRRVQIARARLKQWDKRAEDRFLEALAATCNIRAACSAVGLTPASAYKHRECWPAFGRRWDKVVEIASERIECGLIQAACNFYSSPEDQVPADVPIAGMTAEIALLLLRLHRQGVRGGRRGPGRPPRVATGAEVKAALIARIDELERQRVRRAARERKRAGGV